LGRAIIELLSDNGYSSKVKRLGIEDRTFEHGTQSELHTESGFDPEGIYNASIQILVPAHQE